MVKVREDIPEHADGSVDVTSWMRRVLKPYVNKEDKAVMQALDLALTYGANVATQLGENAFRQGLLVAEILSTLDIDLNVVAAAILYPSVKHANLSLDVIANEVCADVASLIKDVFSLEIADTKDLDCENKTHVARDNLRRMLLSVVSDARVVLIKLAEHVCALRLASNKDDEYKRRLSEKGREIYAPLANRLGIGQLKWEIEDLSFRYLNPIAYKSIAKSLDEKRLQRESYIQDIVAKIRAVIAVEGIQGEVLGRAKHIYSIWRKMQRKGVDFEQIYDVRAVRVLVSSVTECYAALGVVHSLWQYISKEFDDYIASPKDNGYRSLHTAVIGPEGRVVEIQIRTYQMHKESELGFASHWAYKEGRNKNIKYQNKLSNIKDIISWHDEVREVVGQEDTIDSFKNEVFNDSVYVFSPQGKVIALPQNSTPIDFAYAIHTEVGHRCRGAKVNGKLVSLNRPLKSGEQVEIVTAKDGGPSRDWLNAHAGYIKSSKAKAKILHWFKHQSVDENIAQGKMILEREFKKLAISQVNISEIASELNFKTTDAFLQSLGIGEVRLSKVIQLLDDKNASSDVEINIEKFIHKSKKSKNDITLNGIDNLNYSIARCCKPIHGESIIGYVTTGHGISIHRTGCNNVINPKDKMRLVDVSWGSRSESSLFSVDLMVCANDRTGLLLDISSILSKEQVNITATKTLTDSKTQIAKIMFTIEVNDLNKLRRVITHISHVPEVTNVKRVTN